MFTYVCKLEHYYIY